MLGLGLILLWVVIIACYMQDTWRELHAPVLLPVAHTQNTSLISVLIPARNEAQRILDCLAGLAKQSYRYFEVIVVDDDSSDDTVAVVQRYAVHLPSLTLLTERTLPEGWAGKCWACWQAAQHARGDWLVFLDADVVPQPDLLQTLIARAEDQQLGLLTLMPLLRFGSLTEYLVLPAFWMLVYSLYPLHRVNSLRTPLAFANGQCMLVARQAYFACGGHQAVRASILEDVALGQSIKTAGYMLQAAHAPDLISVRMYTGWADLAEGLIKNAVAGFQSGGARSVWVGLRFALQMFSSWYVLICGAVFVWLQSAASIGRMLLLHGVLLMLLGIGWMAWMLRRRYRIASAWSVLVPLGVAIYFGLAARAMWRLKRGWGVVWKGRVFH